MSDRVASPDYRLVINGQEVVVHHCEVASYAVLSGQGPAEVRVYPNFSFAEVVVRPLAAGVVPTIADPEISFTLTLPAKVSVECDGDLRRPLFILANPPEEGQPDREDPSVRWFGGASVHEAGVIDLTDGQTVYIEEGTVVCGRIQARGARGVRVFGRGILDGSEGTRSGGHHQMIKLTECSDVLIEGITVVDGPNWHIVPIACTDVRIHNVNIITIQGTGDGIDVVGSEHVDIRNCFVRSNDDCVAIKAVDYQESAGLKDVKDVSVSRCVFWNAAWGNALEIGYETRCAEISGVVFEDSDIIHCEFEGWQSGGTFTIHNGDRAVVRNVLYRRIRVEDSQEKLIDIKILHSKYSKDPDRGHVEDVRFEDISVVSGVFPVSIVQGFDADHLVHDIVIKGLKVKGEQIRSANEGRMVIELASGVRFE